MSAPCAIGWIRYGVATVLSTISGTPQLVRDGRDVGDVEDVVLRVGDGLREERLGVGPHGRAPGLQVVGILDEADLDADLGQRVVEQVVGAAVQPRAGHDVVAGAGQVEDREGLGGLTGGQEQRRDAAFQRGDALLDDGGGRVADAGVDVALDLQPEQRRGVCGVVERVARWSGRSAGPGRWWRCRAPGRRGSAWSRTTSARWGRCPLLQCSWLGVSPGGGSGRCWVGGATAASGHDDGRQPTVQGQRHMMGLRIRFPCLSGGPFWRTRACRVAGGGYSTWSSPGAPHRGWRVAGQQAGA